MVIPCRYNFRVRLSSCKCHCYYVFLRFFFIVVISFMFASCTMLLLLANKNEYCILRQAFGAHHSASPRASLAAGSGTDNIPSLRSDTPLPQRISAGIPRREHSSDTDVESRRHLRSSTTTTLVVPPVQRSTLCDRAFPVAAPRALNSLPPSLRTVSSLVQCQCQCQCQSEIF